MADRIPRRDALKSSAAAGVALGVGVASAKRAVAASDVVTIGVMGVNGRGSALAKGFARNTGAEVAYVCDVDQRAIDKAVQATASVQSRKPQGVVDVRKILDDKTVDALVIAAPNHWHAPAAILACNAGKHAYVEKPCSHNAREGELLVQAARKNNRIVQHGTQRRSWPGVQEAIQLLHEGAIGKVLHARAWYNSRRGTIGVGEKAPVPSWLNWGLWQGPAPQHEYLDNIVHYNWHWRWHWGGGELANNGIHGLDVARWGMNVDYPKRVVAGGGRYRFDDDQETPDTLNVTYEFDGGSISWEGLSWSPHGRDGDRFGIDFLGDEGSLAITGGGYQIFDMYDKPVEGKKGGGRGGDADHVENFLSGVRSGEQPNAGAEDAHKSTLLCHLGNISYRAGRAIECSPSDGKIKNDPEAAALWQRDYEPGWWTPTV